MNRAVTLLPLLLAACSLERGDRATEPAGSPNDAGVVSDLIRPQRPPAPDVGAVRVDGDFLALGRSLTDWPALAFNYAQQRFSPLTQLTAANLGGLEAAWSVPLTTDAGGSLEGAATPIVAGEILYLAGSGGWVRAFDVRSGEALWAADPEAGAEGAPASDVPPPGAALWKGRLFVARAGGQLASFDAKTGRQLWVRPVGEAGDTITSAPLIADNLVYLGVSRSGRGSVVAVDYGEAAERWRFWTTPTVGDPDGATSDAALAQIAGTWTGSPATATSPDGPVAVRAGARVESLAFDPAGDRLIIGTGAAPGPVGSGLAPARLFSRSLLALDGRTGEFVWHRQLPGQAAAGRPVMLASLPIAGAAQPVALQVTTGGELAIVLLADGSLAGWRTLAAPVVADREDGAPPPALPPAAASYSPDAGLLFVPNLTSAIGAALRAIDPVSGQARWTVERPMAGGGLLSTAGGLVWQGAAGRLSAYRIADGRAVWSAPLGGPVAAPPSSFLVAGAQHVAVVTGGAGARLLLLRVRGAAQQTP